MTKNKKFDMGFSKHEIILWLGSVLLISASFLIFDRENYLTLAASFVGATSLIFNAKGNPFGQLLMVAFSVMYGVISYTFAYYGEMLTYLGMTMPMSVVALISWLKKPYGGRRSEVRVKKITKRDAIFMCVLSVFVTAVFYFVLSAFDTANIFPSTISVTTSFAAVYLTFKRSSMYALAYAANDIVLIVLWTLASAENMKYVSVVVCFVAFLVNDVYGFVSWRRMEKRQIQKTP